MTSPISNPTPTGPEAAARLERLRKVRNLLADALAIVRQARVILSALLAHVPEDVQPPQGAGVESSLAAQLDLAQRHLERGLYDILHEREPKP